MKTITTSTQGREYEGTLSKPYRECTVNSMCDTALLFCLFCFTAVGICLTKRRGAKITHNYSSIVTP